MTHSFPSHHITTRHTRPRAESLFIIFFNKRRHTHGWGKQYPEFGTESTAVSKNRGSAAGFRWVFFNGSLEHIDIPQGRTHDRYFFCMVGGLEAQAAAAELLMEQSWFHARNEKNV